ncbi:MAG: hypothetical protein J0G94_10385 [Sphingomonadales bacterium]|nr:hypothetical protein [Sphingomonadales bacterium]
MDYEAKSGARQHDDFARSGALHGQIAQALAANEGAIYGPAWINDDLTEPLTGRRADQHRWPGDLTKIKPKGREKTHLTTECYLKPLAFFAAVTSARIPPSSWSGAEATPPSSIRSQAEGLGYAISQVEI